MYKPSCLSNAFHNHLTVQLLLPLSLYFQYLSTICLQLSALLSTLGKIAITDARLFVISIALHLLALEVI